MLTTIKDAAEWGLKWGIRLGVCGLVLILLLGWAMNDYATVRQQARNGAAAAAWIEQRIAEQQKAQQAPPQAPVAPK